MFLASMSLSVIAAVINMVLFILKKSEDNVSVTAAIVIAAVIGGVMGLPLLCFFGFHLILSLSGSTTREFLKEYQHNGRDNQWCDVD